MTASRSFPLATIGYEAAPQARVIDAIFRSEKSGTWEKP